MTAAEPTITERVRRLYHLFTAEANALAVGDLADPRWLTERVGRHINDELAAIDAALEALSSPPDVTARVNVLLVDELRPAVRQEVGLRIAQTAFRSAEKSGAIVPKSMLVETRTFLRQAADMSGHEAQQAIRAVTTLVELLTVAKEHEVRP